MAGRPSEEERRTHRRVAKHGLAVDAPTQQLQVALADADTGEISMENWPLLLPSDFVLDSVSVLEWWDTSIGDSIGFFLGSRAAS